MFKQKKLLETNRIEALSDAIFAVAMTLLVVNIAIPNIPKWVNEAQLGQKLYEMIPTFLTFGLSFILLAAFWNIHQKQFAVIRKVDAKLSWINILLLLLVVFVPFSTVLIENYNNTTAALFFHINLLAIGLVYFWHWHYAVKNHLIESGLSANKSRILNIKNLVTPLIALTAIMISFFYPSYSSTIYILIPLIIIFIEKKDKK